MKHTIKALSLEVVSKAKQYYKETIQFVFDSRNECKSFWKKCVEHHAFFRCSAADCTRKDNRLFSKGSSFRPLRSAASPRCPPPFALYSVVSERKKNGGSHPTISHLPNQSHSQDNAGTLDARGHRHDKECAEHQKHRTKQKIPIPKEQQHEKENVSISLPNVLSDDIQVVCRELEIESTEPPKSLSGDNFNNIRPDYDNLSEDSYRLSDHERSTKSDVGMPSRPAYSANFNTKRAGNVVVKRVISQSKSTPQSTDEEDSASNSVASTSTGRRRLKEYPFNSTSFVPIEIDGPNVDISVRRSTGPIYTSTGALLLKPKVISTHESEYSSVKIVPEQIAPSTSTTAPQQQAPQKQLPMHSVQHQPKQLSQQAQKQIPQQPVAHIAPVSEVEPIYGARGPLPGKVITKETMVITPNVKSEDSPNVEKCHLFNSEIPYTLTLRKVDSAESLSLTTFKDKPKEYDTGSLRKLSLHEEMEKLEGVLGVNVIASEKEQKEDSEGSDSLPPPPETVVKPAPPPPPPKPKAVAEHVAELKTSVIMTSVVKSEPKEEVIVFILRRSV
ncbi:unnamed protein product [Strongylus vulgaris]|uniref:FERM C-terminal PH-like domain-containing protein n=1 Tax=Strongylus vulgaris TaxID=40348 RepID=A0A3P7JF69_STRVU|nr:unnamed protein product [Strongylus vulgaris]